MDQFYWPLATERVATAWIPLHAVPVEQGPLMFSVGSQRIRTGRDLEISDESERVMNERLKLSSTTNRHATKRWIASPRCSRS